MTKTTSLVVGMALSALTLTLGTGDANASAYTSYPGSVCRAVSGGSYGFWGGAVINNSTTSTLNVRCPIDRDAENDYLLGVSVRVWDRNPNAAVTCTLYSEYLTGSSVSYWEDPQQLSTTSSSSNYKELFFSEMQPETHGYYYMDCAIPPVYSGSGSGIGSLYFIENGSW